VPAHVPQGARQPVQVRFVSRPGPGLGCNPDAILQLGLSHIIKIIKFRPTILALRNSVVNRAQRLCMKCASGALGDEQYLLFEWSFFRLRSC